MTKENTLAWLYHNGPRCENCNSPQPTKFESNKQDPCRKCGYRNNISEEIRMIALEIHPTKTEYNDICNIDGKIVKQEKITYEHKGNIIEICSIIESSYNNFKQLTGKYTIKTLYPNGKEQCEAHGPYECPEFALEDYLDKTQDIQITRKEFKKLVKMDYAGETGGEPHVMRINPWTNKTELAPVKILG